MSKALRDIHPPDAAGGQVVVEVAVSGLPEAVQARAVIEQSVAVIHLPATDFLFA